MTDAEMDALMAQLWTERRSSIHARVDALAAAVAEGSPSGLEAARGGAHSLVGALGSFGFSDASALARTCEQMLGAPGTTSAAVAGTVDRLRAALVREERRYQRTD
jgi:HPt (histidine-containing phosphotransfer) domain-containing protein